MYRKLCWINGKPSKPKRNYFLRGLQKLPFPCVSRIFLSPTKRNQSHFHIQRLRKILHIAKTSLKTSLLISIDVLAYSLSTLTISLPCATLNFSKLEITIMAPKVALVLTNVSMPVFKVLKKRLDVLNR